MVVEVRRVHERQRAARDQVPRQHEIDLLRHQGRSPEAHRPHREALRLEPLRQEEDLRRAARSVRALEHDQRALQVPGSVHADEGEPERPHLLGVRSFLDRGLRRHLGLGRGRLARPGQDLITAPSLRHRFLGLGREPPHVDPLLHDVPHLLLQLVDGGRAVHEDEVVPLDHAVVVLHDHALEHPEALRPADGKVPVHAGFVVLEPGPADEDAPHGHVERRAEVEGYVRHRGEGEQVPEPHLGAAARGVPGEGRVDVAVGEDKIPAVEKRHDLPLAAVGEVRRVEEREGGGREEALLLSALGRGLDERRGVPLGEMEPVPADLEPPPEQVELRALSGPVDALDDDEGAGVRFRTGLVGKCSIKRSDAPEP